MQMVIAFQSNYLYFERKIKFNRVVLVLDTSRLAAVIPVALTLALVLAGCTATNSVNIVKLSPPDMLEQIKLGKIDAFVAWEPFPSKAVREGFRIFMTSHDIWPNNPCCVVAYRLGQLNDDVLEALVWAHVKATRFINNPEEPG